MSVSSALREMSQQILQAAPFKSMREAAKRTVRTTSGEIVLEQLTDVWEVKASSGAVTIKAQEGSGSICTTSGDIKVDLGRLTGNLTLESSSGLAEIKISDDNAFDFKAVTSSGDIDTFFDDELVFPKKKQCRRRLQNR